MQSKIIPIQLRESTIYANVKIIGGEQDIALKLPKIDDLKESIREISNVILDSMSTVAANKVTVEFGIEIGVKSGQLTSILVEGEGKGSIKVILEWDKSIK
jgi:hypothetical protein